MHRFFHTIGAYFECDILRENLGNVKGVNRAFPYVASDDVDSVIEEHTPVLFRLVRTLVEIKYFKCGTIFF